MTEINWGILGTARIAERLAASIKEADNARLQMVGSRSADRVSKFTAQYHIPQSGTYQEVLDNPAVDAIYIPLPNHLHLKWAEMALQAGKSVLVEKPIVLNIRDLNRLRQVALDTDQLLMEGLMYRFHPVIPKLQELIATDQIGEIEFIQFNFAHSIASYLGNADNYRYYRELGGGALFDLGIYGIDVIHQLIPDTEAEIAFVKSVAYDTKQLAQALAPADRWTKCMLYFDNIQAEIMASFSSHSKLLLISGTSGEIRLNDLSAPGVKEIELRNQQGTEFIAVESCNTYRMEIELFSQSLLDGEPSPISLQSSYRNIDLIERLLQH